MNYQSAYEETDAITWPVYQAAGVQRAKLESVSALKADTALDKLMLLTQCMTFRDISDEPNRAVGIDILGPNATLELKGGVISDLLRMPRKEHTFELENATWYVSSSTNAIKDWLDGNYSVVHLAGHAVDATATTIIPEVQVLGPNPLAGYEEYSKPNWDLYGAVPITAETIGATRWFLTILPIMLGEPHISPGADGTIGLEWVLTDQPLRKLFIDIGPSYVWGGYWRRASGERDTIAPKPIDVSTEAELVELFRRLSQ